jgi:hypothetical protein
MVTLLIIALVLLPFIGIGLAIYFWQKFAHQTSERALPPPPGARGLFASDEATLEKEENNQRAMAAAQRAEQLIQLAQSGERSALDEAHALNNSALYDRVLIELVQLAHTDAKLLALMSHVAQNDLPVNENLARAALITWQQSPSRAGTAKALHFAALSNNATVYRDAVEAALKLWREGKLNGTSTDELKALFDGEFWVLSSDTRSSGAGFVLKQTLASARRELEATPRATR